MIRKPPDLPLGVARSFVKDMTQFFAEEDLRKRAAIAMRQLRALKEHCDTREKPLRLSDIRDTFSKMKNQSG
jgi:hypothetical protein